MNLKVLLFAGLREYYGGQASITMELEKSTWDSCNELKVYLLNRLDEICKNVVIQGGKCDTTTTNVKRTIPPESIMLALNEQFIYDDGQDRRLSNKQLVPATKIDETDRIVLRPADEIALIHPVTGG